MKVLVGVTGGIAAYKALELVRHFVKQGDEVQVVMTSGAKAFVQPLSFQALSGHPVRDELFDSHQEAGMGHIELARWADVIVIAPASAETLAKLRMGRADDLLMTLCLATDKLIMLAPAMNRLMWQNAATQENVAVLKQRGFKVMPPASGEQACGEIGAGRLPEPKAIFDWVYEGIKTEQNKLCPFWQGQSVLITAGPTHEAIDPVRYIANKSSGKMGYAIAEVAAQLGAEVTLISGPVSLDTPAQVKRLNVVTADEMFAQVQQQVITADIFISAAAVADFKVENSSKTQKMKKQPGLGKIQLNLIQNPDIVAWVAQQTSKPFVVGFAAETHQVIEYAKDKLQRKNLDMICANQVGEAKGFGMDTNRLTLISAKREVALSESSKREQATDLLAFIAEEMSH